MKSEPRYAKLFNENEILITSDESREKTVEKERLAVNFNKYTFVAHLCQYPYHVNSVYSLAYNNNNILVLYNFKDDVYI